MTNDISLYVHIPWCEKKCPYCDFNSHATSASKGLDPILERQYIQQLLVDLDRDLETHAIDSKVDTLFIGGGTPSLVSAGGIAELIAGLKARIPFTETAECTLEANPGSSDRDKFSGYRQAGVNRLSLGVQSFSDHSLLQLGRVHNGRDAKTAIAAAREAGFDNINLDLMHGLPGQSPKDALFDLEQTEDFAPEHVSWYQLTIEPNTAFYSAPPVLPDEESLIEVDEIGLEWLQDQGYRRYEVSAYAKEPNYRARHNLNYWLFGDYLGIGAGAHGKISGHQQHKMITRTQKTRVPQHYLADPSASLRRLDRAEIPIEFLMNALRLVEGFTPAQFESTTGLPWSTLQDFIEEGTKREWLAFGGEHLRTTSTGFIFLDSLLLLI
ncbi:MAG: radical SAM family heme chaperone HemW [Pseudomonadales bacterium]